MAHPRANLIPQHLMLRRQPTAGVVLARPQLAGPTAAMLPGMGQMLPGMGAQDMLPGMGEYLGTAAGSGDAYGLPPQDLINALYDIFGSYPRKNVLPYANSFSLLASTGTALTALGTSSPTITTTADAAHIVTLVTGASTGEYSILLRTDSSDRQITQQAIHSATMVGTAERPFPFPKPLLLAPNTTVSFTITDLSNAQNEVWFTFWGFKVYRRQYAAAA